MKRIAAYILCGLLCASAFSCGTKSDDASETTSASETTQNEVTEADTLSDNLPDKDYSGENFVLLAFEQSYSRYGTEDLNGDVINDALYERNRTIEERYNINLDVRNSGENDATQIDAIKRSVLAGSKDYDTVIVNSVYAAMSSLDNLYVNLYDIPHLDFSRPWWNKYSVDEMTVLGQMYLGSSAMSYTSFAQSNAIFVNRDKLGDYGLTMPYDKVYDGTWTLDALSELIKGTYVDVNGDGAADRGDFYGFSTYAQREIWTIGFNIKVVSKDDDEVLKLTANTQRTASAIEDLYSFYYENPDVLITKDYTIDGLVQTDWHPSNFTSGNTLTIPGMISHFETYIRYGDFDCGVLPVPKYDDDQDDYYTFEQAYMFVVPQTMTDGDMTGIIIEALSAEGYKQLIPAYYEVAFQGKFFTGNDDTAMLQIVYNSQRENFAYVYNSMLGISQITDTLMDKKTKDFASYYDKTAPKAEEKMQTLIEFFKEHQG